MNNELIERGVSYGATYVVDHPCRLATVSVGYADGYARSLSNKGWVLIHGQKAPIVGRVCMDQMMIDITDIPDVKLEDTVTVPEFLTIKSSSDTKFSIDTTGYEIEEKKGIWLAQNYILMNENKCFLEVSIKTAS